MFFVAEQTINEVSFSILITMKENEMYGGLFRLHIFDNETEQPPLDMFIFLHVYNKFTFIYMRNINTAYNLNLINAELRSASFLGGN